METLLTESDSSWIRYKIEERLGSIDIIVEALKPSIFPDGNQWCCLYGANIQEGVCGFGDTPAMAMNNFVHNFYNENLSKNK